ncbi:MAG TPA: hypothetical protein VN690_11240 [Terriglobales bacterium]|nr:hypothetical protein [Terriglobales bacterium]
MSAVVGPPIQSGIASTASSTAQIMARLRPKRSEPIPKSRPPAIAPTMATILISAVACTL